MRQPFYNSKGREKCWKGHAAAIRALLEAEGPMSDAEIALSLELTLAQVKSATQQMASRTGGIQRCAGDADKWEVFKPKQRTRSGSGKVAGPRVIRGYRYGWGFLG